MKTNTRWPFTDIQQPTSAKEAVRLITYFLIMEEEFDALKECDRLGSRIAVVYAGVTRLQITRWAVNEFTAGMDAPALADSIEMEQRAKLVLNRLGIPLDEAESRISNTLDDMLAAFDVWVTPHSGNADAEYVGELGHYDVEVVPRAEVN